MKIRFFLRSGGRVDVLDLTGPALSYQGKTGAYLDTTAAERPQEPADAPGKPPAPPGNARTLTGAPEPRKPRNLWGGWQ